MKLCNSCNASVEDNVRFCPNCGCADFRFNNGEAPTELLNEQSNNNAAFNNANGFKGQGGSFSSNVNSNNGNSQYGSYPNSQNNNSQNNVNNGNNYISSNSANQMGAVPVKQKKKKRVGLIVGIIVSLFVLCAIGGLAEKAFSSSSEKSNPYVQGVIENGVYTSSWANLKFDMTSGEWSEASQELYDSYSDENTVCDFYAVRSDRALVAVLSIDISDSVDKSFVSESSLLKSMSDSIKDNAGSVMEQTEPIETQLCGDSYYVSSITLGDEYFHACSTLYLRRIGNHVLVINITGPSKEDNYNIANLFVPADS